MGYTTVLRGVGMLVSGDPRPRERHGVALTTGSGNELAQLIGSEVTAVDLDMRDVSLLVHVDTANMRITAQTRRNGLPTLLARNADERNSESRPWSLVVHRSSGSRYAALPSLSASWRAAAPECDVA
jgi:hypothetical protein